MLQGGARRRVRVMLVTVAAATARSPGDDSFAAEIGVELLCWLSGTALDLRTMLSSRIGRTADPVATAVSRSVLLAGPAMTTPARDRAAPGSATIDGACRGGLLKVPSVQGI